VNCLDCAQDLDTDRPAIAVCSTCGAAVCISHAVVALFRRPVGPGSGQPMTTESPSRNVTCLTCAQAVHGSLAEQASRVLRTRYRFRGSRAGIQAARTAYPSAPVD
jgi:hypothetical protein